MSRTVNVCLIMLSLVLGWGLISGHEQPLDAAATKTPEYRVMSLFEMFSEDELAKKKLAQLIIKVKREGEPQRVQRTDMDAKDYERALNRLAAEGWTLVTVNKSNYWVFKKE